MKKWLAAHCLNIELIQSIITAHDSFEMSKNLLGFSDDTLNYETVVLPNLSQTYRELIIPAFEAAFPPEAPVSDLLSSVIFQSFTDDTNNSPYTIDIGKGHAPIVAMCWQGTPDDLVCLAHEAAHALQIFLSDHALMPPLARETCAFLGELILIKHIQKIDRELFTALSQVWYNENKIYLGEDLDRLSIALQNPVATYHYRQNYPIARLVATQIYSNTGKEQIKALFSSGENAMLYLPLKNMASKDGEAPNYLPPMPPSHSDNPATEAYTTLGAIALLDIAFWEGEAQKIIANYYANVLGHLQNCTAFIALNDLQKPIGYATWRKPNSSAPVILTHQTAPFGDNLTLQKAVERHLQQTVQVSGQHNRVAREE